MEVIIATITVIGTIVSSFGSIYIDRRLNRNNEDNEDNINIIYHEIFNYINTFVKNALPYMYFGNNITNEMIRLFLKKRMEHVMYNLKKLIEIEHEIDKLLPEVLIKRITDMLNGLNEFKDVNDPSLYNDIPVKFINNFNNWNNRCYVLLSKYLQSNPFNSNKVLLNNFLNIYNMVIESMANNLMSNLYLLIDKDCIYKGKHLNYNINKVPNYLLTNTMNVLREKVDIEKYIDTLLIDEKNKLLNKKNLLFCINVDFEIIYCTQSCEKLNYGIDKLIGSHILTLCSHNEDLNEIDKFFNNKDEKMLFIKILSKDNIELNVVIKTFEEFILCFTI